MSLMEKDPLEEIIDLKRIRPLQEALVQHPIYSSIDNLAKLRCFMEHHFFAVWDFMTLLKYLQHRIAPTKCPWTPISHPAVCRFINEIVLEEESGPGLPNDQGQPTFISHFELYCHAMCEVGTDVLLPSLFTGIIRNDGLENALNSGFAPKIACKFMQTTFRYIDQDQPHEVASIFAIGRETLVPQMFQSVLKKIKVQEAEAPSFYFYLQRHIDVDQGSHGPLAVLMLKELCQNDSQKLSEAEEAACEVLESRLKLWDGIYEAIQQVKENAKAPLFFPKEKVYRMIFPVEA